MSEGARRRPHAGGPEKAMRLLLYVTTHMTHMHLECWLELLALAETSKTSSPTRGRRGGIGWSKASSSISKTRGRTSEGRTSGGEGPRHEEERCKVVGGRLLKLYLELSSLLPYGTHPAIRSRACTMD